MIERDKISCPNCGHWTGLCNPFHMVIPEDGLKCTKCGCTVIKGSGISWENEYIKSKRNKYELETLVDETDFWTQQRSYL